MTSPTAPTVILIPSYEPDDRLVRLVDSLGSSTSVPIVVVDDGSGPSSRRSSPPWPAPARPC